jgi:hypothetical protein
MDNTLNDKYSCYKVGDKCIYESEVSLNCFVDRVHKLIESLILIHSHLQPTRDCLCTDADVVTEEKRQLLWNITTRAAEFFKGILLLCFEYLFLTS